jgi:hypothetical protein
VIALVLLGCQAPTPEAPSPPTPVLLEGPDLVVAVPDGPLDPGDPVDVRVEASDPDGVDAVALHVRTAGELAFARVPLTEVDGAWAGQAPADVVQPPGVEWWVEAFDRSDWRVASRWPEQGADRPGRIDVRDLALAPPFAESFEGTTSLQYGHLERGWRDHAEAFRGRRWRLQADEDGSVAAVHPAGFVGMDPVDDWLVGPTLDLTDLPTAEVRWRERTGPGTPATHSLWVSTGSADPAAGDYEPVLALPTPRETWGPGPLGDLTPWVGGPVTLAWRYEGGNTAAWWIDDVHVGPLAPDVRIAHVEQPFLEPGDAGTLTVTVENRGADASGGWLEGSAASGVAFAGPVPFDPLPRGAVVDLSLDLVVDVDRPDHRVAPTTLSVLHDDGRWDQPNGLQIGEPALGLVELDVDVLGTVDLRMGTGRADRPDDSIVVFQGVLPAGHHSFTLDLEPYVDRLPAARGPNRWWLAGTATSAVRVTAFGIDFDGSVAWSTAGGRLVDGPFHLPARPRLVSAGLGVVDGPLRPGVPGAVRLAVRNLGGDLDVPWVGWIRPGDPRLTTGPDPFQGDIWPRGTERIFTLPVTVAADHTDGTALPFTLDVHDGLDVHDVHELLPVPWPRLGAGAVFVSADGVFDPGETTDVLFTVRNDGQLATGDLSCSLMSDGPAATVVTGPTDLSLDAGAFALVGARLTAVGGAPGDVLPFTLSCSGALGSFVRPLEVVLGGVPWAVLPIDPAGDALPGASLDIREVRWRRVGGELALQIRAVQPIDPDPHLEIWMDNPGSTWTHHVLTLTGGVATLSGVRSSGWIALTTPTVQVAGDTLTITFVEAEMDLTDPQLAVAMGTGFCGALGFHCDQWPDGWGNPFVPPIDTSSWIVLSWTP